MWNTLLHDFTRHHGLVYVEEDLLVFGGDHRVKIGPPSCWCHLWQQATYMSSIYSLMAIFYVAWWWWGGVDNADHDGD
jgi:hypothetical protein